MNMKLLRIYLDTSVFGGCLDEEFSADSRKLFEEIKRGKFTPVISDTTLAELEPAPVEVRSVLEQIIPENAEFVSISEEVLALRNAYLDAGVVGYGSTEDAEHVAAATAAGVDMVVSWNFKHIVHYDKIAGYNAVNMAHGYRVIQIFSPREVVEP